MRGDGGGRSPPLSPPPKPPDPGGTGVEPAPLLGAAGLCGGHELVADVVPAQPASAITTAMVSQGRAVPAAVEALVDSGARPFSYLSGPVADVLSIRPLRSGPVAHRCGDGTPLKCRGSALLRVSAAGSTATVRVFITQNEGPQSLVLGQQAMLALGLAYSPVAGVVRDPFAGTRTATARAKPVRTKRRAGRRRRRRRTRRRMWCPPGPDRKSNRIYSGIDRLWRARPALTGFQRILWHKSGQRPIVRQHRRF